MSVMLVETCASFLYLILMHCLVQETFTTITDDQARPVSFACNFLAQNYSRCKKLAKKTVVHAGLFCKSTCPRFLILNIRFPEYFKQMLILILILSSSYG